jgi:hypothetical protein
MNGGFDEIATRVVDELADRLNALGLRAYVLREIDRQLAGGDPAKPEPLATPSATPGVGLKVVLQAAGLSERRRVKLIALVLQVGQDVLREKMSRCIASELTLRVPSRSTTPRGFDEWSNVLKAQAAVAGTVAALKLRGERMQRGRRAS